MKIDIDDDVRELKHAISGLLNLTSKIIDGDHSREELAQRWEDIARRFHDWRTRRFDNDIVEAEKILDKAGQLGDYGASWSGSKFIFNPNAKAVFDFYTDGISADGGFYQGSIYPDAIETRPNDNESYGYDVIARVNKHIAFIWNLALEQAWDLFTKREFDF
jgi:hypothetical protein